MYKIECKVCVCVRGCVSLSFMNSDAIFTVWFYWSGEGLCMEKDVVALLSYNVIRDISENIQCKRIRFGTYLLFLRVISLWKMAILEKPLNYFFGPCPKITEVIPCWFGFTRKMPKFCFIKIIFNIRGMCFNFSEETPRTLTHYLVYM